MWYAADDKGCHLSTPNWQDQTRTLIHTHLQTLTKHPDIHMQPFTTPTPADTDTHTHPPACRHPHTHTRNPHHLCVKSGPSLEWNVLSKGLALRLCALRGLGTPSMVNQPPCPYTDSTALVSGSTQLLMSCPFALSICPTCIPIHSTE